MRRLAALLGTMVLLAGCGGEHPSGPPGVEIGHGADRFHALADGDTVPINRGTQGGYHVYGALRARGVDPSAVEVVFTIALGDALPLTMRRDLADLAGTSEQLLGSVVFLPDPTAVRDQPCRFHVEITDRAGLRASDERTVVPTGP